MFDTQPGLPLKMDIELPETLVPYLKLFPYRLHVPQIYTLLALEEPDPSLLLLLEQVPLSGADLGPSDPGAGYGIGTGIPLMEAWPQAQSLRQLHWLWQIAQLWQPLRIQGVASSLLQTDFLRIEGPLLRLLELENDFRLEPSLADLGQVWQQLIPRTKGNLAASLDTLCNKLTSGEMTAPEELLSQLERWIENGHQAYRVKIDIATRTDTGMVREHNEDACYPDHGAVTQNSTERMAIVCDGVGGHDGGEVASGIAIEALREHLTNLPIDDLSAAEVITELENASFKANDLICQRNDLEQRQDRQRMGTTLVAALNQKHQIYVSHIGDSRAYLITTQGCYQIMVDDDIASREVRLGYIPYREALLQPASGSLVQALGMASSSVLRPTVQRFLLDEDCIFLLCSDGLSDYERVEMIWRDELLPLLQGSNDLTSVSKRLIELANQLNGHDNVTVGVVHCHVTRQRQGASGLFDGAPDLSAVDDTPPTVLPTTPLSTTPTVVREAPPVRKRGGIGLLLLLGLLLLGVGGAVAYGLGLVKLPFANLPDPTPAPSSPLPTPSPTDNPEALPNLDNAQKTDVLRLKTDKQPLVIPIATEVKALLTSEDQPSVSPATKTPTPSLVSEITIPKGNLVVIDEAFPPTDTSETVVPENPVQAIKIRVCRSVTAKKPQDQLPGAGSIKPGPLELEGADPIPKVSQFVDFKAENTDVSAPTESEPQIGWVKRSQLEPLVAKVIPASDLSEDQEEACAPSPVEGKDIPAKATVGSDK